MKQCSNCGWSNDLSYYEGKLGLCGSCISKSEGDTKFPLWRPQYNKVGTMPPTDQQVSMAYFAFLDILVANGVDIDDSMESIYFAGFHTGYIKGQEVG